MFIRVHEYSRCNDEESSKINVMSQNLMAYFTHGSVRLRLLILALSSGNSFDVMRMDEWCSSHLFIFDWDL
jgi:hypothetical protein